MGSLVENILATQNLIKETPVGSIDFPIRAKLEYNSGDDSFWFCFYAENSNLALGSADMYKIPDDLRKSMNLDSLLQHNETVVVKPSEEFNKTNHLTDVAGSDEVENYVQKLITRKAD